MAVCSYTMLRQARPHKTQTGKIFFLPVWYVPEIGEARKLRDKFKRLNEWPEYKKYRNKTKNLIRKAKRKYLQTLWNLRKTQAAFESTKAL